MPGGRLRRLGSSGAAWAVLILAVVATQLPAIVHQFARAPIIQNNADLLERTLDAIYITRKAERRGTCTVLVAGTSVANGLPAERLYPQGQAAVAVVHGTPFYHATAFGRFLIDVAPPDILVVPVTWEGFPPGPRADGPQPAKWQRHPHDTLMRRLGLGTVLGIPRQIQVLGRQALATMPGRATSEGEPPGLVPDDLALRYTAHIQEVLRLSHGASAAGLQRMHALTQYGLVHGVVVVYYLSPVNPVYSTRHPESFALFRSDLAPYLVLDASDALPADRFRLYEGRVPDLDHFDAKGSAILADMLAAALARYDCTVGMTPRAFGWRQRLAFSVLSIQRDLDELTEVRVRPLVRQIIAQARLFLADYGRTIRRLSGEPTRPTGTSRRPQAEGR